MPSISTWVEALLFSFAFVLIVGITLVDMNHNYNQSYNATLLESEAGSSNSLFVEYNKNAYNESGGEVTNIGFYGYTLKNGFGIFLDLFRTVWGLINGGWILNVFHYIGGGEEMTIIASFLQILWMVSLVGAILYAIFKVSV